MSFNTTNVTGPANTSLSYNSSVNTAHGREYTRGYAPTNNLGYGVGKILRGAYDGIAHTWQKIWTKEPSKEELVAKRQIAIYQKGLQECVLQLGKAVERLRINPHDSSAVKKIHELVKHYAFYLAPQKNDSEQFSLQLKAFKPLADKITRIAKPHLITTLSTVLEQVLPFSILEKTLSKRSLQQASVWPASFNLGALDGANGFVVPGIATRGYLGVSVSTIGDLNGDGKADLVLGAYGASSNVGAAYVLFGQASGWPASFNLATLDGANGFAVPGIAASGGLGLSVSTAGDLNGDGKADLVLGASGVSTVSSNAGAVYVLFGQAGEWPASFNLATLNGTNGFTIPGITTGGALGVSVSTAGDLNGDGKTDLVLGAEGISSGRGAAYVLFGQADGWPASFNLTTLDGTNGFTVPGVATYGQLGVSVSTAGDLNGDGKADLVLGAYGFSSNTGMAYVLFGQASGWPASFNLATLNGTNGFTIPGITAGGYLGASVSTAGDLNGDGKADLVLGAYGVSSSIGVAYVLFGQANGWPASFNLATLNGTNGFTIPGITAGGALGISVSTAGDLNGDGKTDLVLGAKGVSSDAGAAYVLFGQADGWPASFNLTILNGTNGFAFPGIAAVGELGYSVSTAGDLNGDGKADLVLGAFQTSSQAGAAYVIFGSNTTLPTPTWASTPTPQLTPVTIPTPSSILTPTPVPTSTLASTVSPMSTPAPNSVLTPTLISPNGSPLPISPSLSATVNSPKVGPSSNAQTIGIGAGVGGVVLLGGLVGTILLLRSKKKACFADGSNDERARSETLKAYS